MREENSPDKDAHCKFSTCKVKLQDVRRIAISSEFIRLDSLLKYAAVASTGGEAKVMILNGEVFLGGKPCLQRGRKIRPGDVVRIGRKSLLVTSKHTLS